MTNDHGGFGGAGTQFVLSYELLSLLRWLAEHNPHELKELIKRAYRSGLRQQLIALDRPHVTMDTEEIREGIVNFFALCEQLLADANHEDMKKRAQDRRLLSAIDHIDMYEYDDDTVLSSLERATEEVENNPGVNAEDVLFEELLKRWRPHSKTLLN